MTQINCKSKILEATSMFTYRSLYQTMEYYAAVNKRIYQEDLRKLILEQSLEYTAKWKRKGSYFLYKEKGK